MRVLITTDAVGGVWTFTKELAGGLLRSGHAIALASFGRSLSKEQRHWCTHIEQEYGSDFLCMTACTPLEWMEDNHLAYDDAELLLLRMADKFRPDLFHANQYCLGRLPLPVPTVITAHSDVLSWAGACRPGGLEPSRWLDQYKRLVAQGLLKADAVVSPTYAMLDALSANFTVPLSKHVIQNGRTIPPNNTKTERVMQAVTVGRLWDAAKNVAMLSRMRVPFPVFAVGEQQYESTGMPEVMSAVQLLGRMDEQTLFTLFCQSSIYLVTSIYEPFGLAPLEAALCGCAVVANDISSLREVWGEAAVYFRNANDLNGILEYMNASANTLQAAQRRSYRRGLELTAERMTDAYLSLYKDLLVPDAVSSPQELTTIAS